MAAGVGVLAAAWLGPLPELARSLFIAHMTMHVAVVAVAAPLIAAGVAGTRWSRHAAPLPASLIELVVVWAWHAPALHALSRSSLGWLAVEQGMFLAAALWVWIGALNSPANGATAAGIGALLMTSMHMTLLGALLSVGPRLLFHTHDGGSADALGDQQAGGLIMVLVGGVSYLIGGLWLLAAFLREKPKNT